MDMSIFDKIGTIFQYTFSSFVGIELFIANLLLFSILIINIYKNNKIFTIVFSSGYLIFASLMFISSHEYTVYSVKTFIKLILKYIYFPSTVVYFFIILFTMITFVYSIISKKLSKFKKTFNYSFFSIMVLLYTLFITCASKNGVDLSDLVSLYQNNVILSIVQCSNLLLVIWIIFTFFYRLHLIFKKVDNENRG